MESTTTPEKEPPVSQKKKSIKDLPCLMKKKNELKLRESEKMASGP